jgi:hypothetical protein
VHSLFSLRREVSVQGSLQRRVAQQEQKAKATSLEKKITLVNEQKKTEWHT